MNNKWVYSDTEEDINKVRPCINCGKYPTEEDHDGCLGTLQGVMNACCGHGEEDQAYIQFLDGYCIYGQDAAVILEILKKYRKDSDRI